MLLEEAVYPMREIQVEILGGQGVRKEACSILLVNPDPLFQMVVQNQV